MALIRPTAAQINTLITTISDPLVVLNQGSTAANIDIGFILNRNPSANVAIVWQESSNQFILANTSSSGSTNANITVSNYANLRAGNISAISATITNLIGNANITVTGSMLPSANITYDLGSPTQRWREGWFSGSTIHIGNESMSVSNDGTWAFTSNGATVVLGTDAVFNPPSANISGNITAGNFNFTNGVSIVTTLSSAIAITNSAISIANTALKGYTDGQITTVSNSVTGATAAIVTANTALKGYVDAANTIQSNEITAVSNSVAGANASITGANAAITTVTNSVTGANAAITTVTNSVTGANAAIVTANTALKGYVDGQISTRAALTGATFSGAVTTTELFVTSPGGDEGGQLNLSPAVTNTTLVGNVTIDVYQNKLRIWEGGGTNRGGYFDLSGLSAGVGTNLVSAGSIPGGADTQVQFNNSSSFAGAVSLHYFTGNGVVLANATVASTSTTTGALQVSGGIGVGGNVWCGQVYSTNNGNGTNYRIGDDAWLGDVNMADTTQLMGAQNGNNGYLRFGNVGTETLGRAGSGALTWTGTFSAGNINSDNHNYANGTSIITTLSTAISTANTALKGYTDGQITTVTNSVTGANAAIVTANTAMKGYADAITTAWQSNATTQLSQITGANAAIVTANTAMKGYVDSIDTTKANLSGATFTGNISAPYIVGAIAIDGNLTVSGNLNVTGTQTIFSSNNVQLNDTLLYLAHGNSGDALDIGFVASFTNPGYQHTGLVRDASDGVWKLFANVATEPSTIVDFTNATYSNLKIGNLITSSVTYANGQSILTNVESAITTANTAMKGYTDAAITTVSNSVTGANAAIVTANTAMQGYVDAVTTAWQANATTQLSQITGANAAIVTANTAMKGYVDGQITSVTNSVTGANAAIVTANTAMKGYVDAQDTAISNSITGANAAITTVSNSVTGANAAIVTANTAMKGYVDAVTTAWTANATTQLSQITGANASITGANAAITTVSNSVTGANAAIVTANTAMKGYVDAQDTAISNSVTGANATMVTSVTGTAPVTSSGGKTPAIGMAAATASVNGYMTSTYASKLDGIAAGATNVTNTNQLTNDAGFITSGGTATNLYGAGASYIASSSSGTGYGSAIQIREAGLAGAQASAIAAAPRLAFHWSGVVASSIVMEASGRIAIVNNPGTSYEAFACGVMTGTATNARYADLAENYSSDKKYVPGTVVVFGGNEEITISTFSHDTAVAGVISTNPAHLMNSELDGLPVALQGRVPCRVQGPINKGELVVTSGIAGVAQRLDRAQYLPGCVIGKALEYITEDRIVTIEVVVGRI